jgi:hypothetical protein
MNNTPPTKISQLKTQGVTVRKVSDIYADHPYSDNGQRIADSDMDKWMVTVLAGSWPNPVIRNIPLAPNETLAWENACQHLEIPRHQPKTCP